MSLLRVLIILTIYENIFIQVYTFKLFSQITVLGIIIAFMRVLSNLLQMIKFLLGRKWPLCPDEHQEEGAANKGKLLRRGRGLFPVFLSFRLQMGKTETESFSNTL